MKKGDAVTNGQVVVLLDDTEFKARLAQADGAVATAKANVMKAQAWFDRVNKLAATDIESKQAQDDVRLALEAFSPYEPRQRAQLLRAIAENILPVAYPEPAQWRQDVSAALESLPAHYRQVILLRDLEGLTITEMAQQLGLGREAVKSRLHRARVLAREYLDS